MVKSSIIRAPCNHVNLSVDLDWVHTGSNIVKPSNCLTLRKQNLHKKNRFAKVFKNLARYRSKNNYVEQSKYNKYTGSSS